MPENIDVLKWVSITMNIMGMIALPLIIYVFKLKEKAIVERVDKEEERSKAFYRKTDEIKIEIDEIKDNYLERFDNVKEHISLELGDLKTNVAVILEKLNK